MNKILVMYGIVMLGITTTSQEKVTSENYCDEVKITDVILAEEDVNTALNDAHNLVWEAPKLVGRLPIETTSELDLSEIEYLDERSDFDLGFDTKVYLPEGFDPYKAYFDMDSVLFIEENETDLGIDSAQYLPEGFDPYAYPYDISGINYIEDEDFELGFETASYLPKHFNAYEVYFDLDSVEYIEIEDELDLNTEHYLPSVNSLPSSK